jgi:hypothetical protein
MKYFGSNIRINGAALATVFLEVYGPEREQVAKEVATKYEERVTRLLGLIYEKSAGKALLTAIGRLSHRTMTIEPKVQMADPGCGSPDEINAYATPAGLFPEHVFKRGSITSVEGMRGTGDGGDTTVCLTPNEWLNSDIKGKLGLNANSEFSADDMLVHEMVHGLRMMAGVRKNKKVPFQWRLVKYDKEEWEKTPAKCREGERVKYKGTIYIKEDCYPDIEEWFAVLIQNIYRSQCNRLLRVAYTRAVGNFTEKQFIRLGMNRSHMRQFRREHRNFFSDLRELDIQFNPTRLILDL